MSFLPLSRVGEREEVANFARHVPNLALRPGTPGRRAHERQKMKPGAICETQLNDVIAAAAP